MQTPAAPQSSIKLYRCPTCALYMRGGHNLPGVEEHVWIHRVQSTKCLREIFESGDYPRFFRAVQKSNALRGDFLNSLWSCALTLAIPDEHSEALRADALAKIPGLLSSQESDDYRHAKSRGLIHPVRQFR